MKTKSVVLIEPSGNESNVFENYMHLPLTGLLYLGTILHNSGFDVRILNENLLGKKIDPFEVHADVYCITSLTVSANRAKWLATQFKRIYPQSKVIIGGIHASLLPEDFSEAADHVVIGEAEDIIVDVVSGKRCEKIIHGSPVKDLDALPLINYTLLANAEKMSIIPIMTSRGCPFDCNFCTVTKIFGKQFRMQSVDRIMAEIQNAMMLNKTKRFFFYDDNFTANRKRIQGVCEALLAQKIELTWSAQVRSDLAKDPELLELMAKAGCNRVYVGFESINDQALKALHKSQTRADIEKAIMTFHASGIQIHGMFMFGEDNDTLENIHDTVDFALRHEIDTVQFMILTPFPGTQIYDKIVAENRLFHQNWDYYDAMYIVFAPKNLDAFRLQTEMVNAYKKFYSLRRTLLGAFDIMVNIVLDSLVWNFERAFRYNAETILLRASSKIIIHQFEQLYTGYLDYLGDLQAKSIAVKTPDDQTR